MHFSVWTPDGRYWFWVVETAWRGCGPIYQPRPSRSLKAEQIAASLNRDRTRLAFHALDPTTHFDLWTVSIHSSTDHPTAGQPEVFLRTPAIETYPTLHRMATG
jgi:hypothetical protein